MSVPMPKRRRALLTGLVFLVAVLATAVVLLRSRLLGLPYQDSFTAGTADEWHALGGTWELANGAIRNESDERGAKLITGSKSWRDYSLEADIQLLGRDGDAGLVARSSDEENGVDSYSGYYAGLRNHDNTLVLGRADHGWIDPWRCAPLSLVSLAIDRCGLRNAGFGSRSFRRNSRVGNDH
jgi:hypothetical protein